MPITGGGGTVDDAEQWLHDNHWGTNDVEVAVAGGGGAQNLGAAVAVDHIRRIREVTVRHTGTDNTVVTITDGVNMILALDVTAQTTVIWFSQDGRAVTAGNTPQVQTSDVTGGSTFVSVAGVEAEIGEFTCFEQWLHDNHWDVDEITVAVAGGPGEQNLGAAVAAGEVRRIREVTVRHTGSENTVVSILDQTAGNTVLSIDVVAQSTKIWSSEDGRSIAATLQPVVQSSDVTGGNTYITCSGVEV